MLVIKFPMNLYTRKRDTPTAFILSRKLVSKKKEKKHSRIQILTEFVISRKFLYKWLLNILFRFNVF